MLRLEVMPVGTPGLPTAPGCHSRLGIGLVFSCCEVKADAGGLFLVLLGILCFPRV